MAEQELVQRRFGTSTLAVPGDWDVLVDTDLDTPFVAIEPPRSGFRANLVVTRTRLEGMSFRDWQVGTDGVLARALREYRLLDLERLTVAGRAGGRRLAQHVTAEGDAVVLEQWCVVAGGCGWALTSSIDVSRYDLLTDLSAACARSLELGGADA